MTREQEYINQLIGEYFSLKLSNSKYKDKSREEQLAYMLGLAIHIITDSCLDDNITLSKLKSKVNK